MPSHREHMEKATDGIFDRMGSPGVYTSPGVSLPGKTILRKSVQTLGEFGQVTGRRDELSIRNKHVSVQLRDAVVTFDTDTGLGAYKLKQQISDDGFYRVWIVEKQNG